MDLLSHRFKSHLSIDKVGPTGLSLGRKGIHRIKTLTTGETVCKSFCFMGTAAVRRLSIQYGERLTGQEKAHSDIDDHQ